MRFVWTIPLFGLVLWACGSDDAGFGDGGSSVDALDCAPYCDEPDTASSGDDTASSGDDTGDTAVDTAVDTADTADTGEGGSGKPEGTGYDVGDIVYDLAGTDQNGSDWSLYGSKGLTQVLVIGHAWDDNTAYIADLLPTLQAKNTGLDATVVLEQALDATTADQDDAADFADSLALERVVWGADTASWAATTPKTYVIDRNLQIQMAAVGIVYADDLQAAIEGSP